jgi:hypothetical protein
MQGQLRSRGSLSEYVAAGDIDVGARRRVPTRDRRSCPVRPYVDASVTLRDHFCSLAPGYGHRRRTAISAAYSKTTWGSLVDHENIQRAEPQSCDRRARPGYLGRRGRPQHDLVWSPVRPRRRRQHSGRPVSAPGLFGVVRRPGVQHHVCAVGEESGGDGTTDTDGAAGAGHERRDR